MEAPVIPNEKYIIELRHGPNGQRWLVGCHDTPDGALGLADEAARELANRSRKVHVYPECRMNIIGLGEHTFGSFDGASKVGSDIPCQILITNLECIGPMVGTVAHAVEHFGRTLCGWPDLVDLLAKGHSDTPKMAPCLPDSPDTIQSTLDRIERRLRTIESAFTAS